MQYELRKKEGYELNSAIADELLEKEFTSETLLTNTFYNVSTFADILNWMDQSYFPTIYGDWPTGLKPSDSTGALDTTGS